MEAVMGAAWAKIEAIDGISWARTQIFSKIIIESDCAGVINRFTTHRDDITIIGNHLAEVKKGADAFEDCTFGWTKRNCSRAANKLSELVLKMLCNFSFQLDFPKEIHNIVINDSF